MQGISYIPIAFRSVDEKLGDPCESIINNNKEEAAFDMRNSQSFTSEK